MEKAKGTGRVGRRYDGWSVWYTRVRSAWVWSARGFLPLHTGVGRLHAACPSVGRGFPLPYCQRDRFLWLSP